MRTCVVFAILLAASKGGSRRQIKQFRVVGGQSDINNEYPFVLPFFRDSFGRFCTGTLIASQWVLSAAHCFVILEKLNLTQTAFVIYGDITKEPFTRKRVLRAVNHPDHTQLQLKGSLHSVRNDIAVVQVEKVPITPFGRVSAADYSSFIGQSVVYIGAGGTYTINDMLYDKNKYIQTFVADQYRSLQIGQAVVTKCSVFTFNPVICLRPKCNNKHSFPQFGDSGGPAFIRGRIVGVCTAGENEQITVPEGYYTPVSPYLDWIQQVIKMPSKINN